LDSCGVVGTSRWLLNRCPHVLHFVCFDRLGTNRVHAQGSCWFEAPVQVMGMEAGKAEKSVWVIVSCRGVGKERNRRSEEKKKVG